MEERKEACEECEHEKRMARALAEMPSEEGIAEMCGRFKVLGDPSRLKILLSLFISPEIL